MGKRILFIDDEKMVLEAVELILEDMGYDVTTFSRSIDGEKDALANDYDLILVDLRMPERNGAELTASILAKKPNAKVLVVTAFPQDILAARALEAGAMALVRKPFEVAKILEYLNQ